ncbi:hypothetical protein GCM10009838_62180 [Catenulispora subtropica]|uniref:Uncharacterized protein n=1 Tax=Catenulispora subtropica TaxID=450798 RepID=A0ABN2SPY7_9ACTN
MVMRIGRLPAVAGARPVSIDDQQAQEGRTVITERQDPQLGLEGGRLPERVDTRVAHAIGRNIEWLYDPSRFPGWSTTIANPSACPQSANTLPATWAADARDGLPPRS